MFLLGLLLAICYVPGITGASVPTQWVLLSAILPLGLWRSGVLGPTHFAGLAILAWSALSLLWVPNLWDGLYGFWILAILALAFWLGSTISDFRGLWKGLALGLSCSSLVAISQWLGYAPVESAPGNPSGLFFNSTLLGASCAIVLIALWSEKLWLWMPGILPGLILANSRGAYLVLAFVIASRYVPLLLLSLALMLAAIAFSLVPNDSDSTRLMIWGMALRELTFFGHGIGSFGSFIYIHHNTLVIPDRVHNDYLQLWFELGPASLAIGFIYAVALFQRQSPLWPIFLAFAILGLFYFPLWAPIPAFIGAMVAGRLASDWHHSLFLRAGWRSGRLPRHPHLRSRIGSPRGQALPVVSST